MLSLLIKIYNKIKKFNSQYYVKNCHNTLNNKSLNNDSLFVIKFLIIALVITNRLIKKISGGSYRLQNFNVLFEFALKQTEELNR